MDKDQEREIAKLLLRNLPDAPAGSLEDHEGPDFLLRTSRGLVGIEVVELFDKRPAEGNQTPAREFGQVMTVLSKAQEQSRERGLPPLQVVVQFTGDRMPDRQSSALAQELVDLVSAALPPPGGFATLEQTYNLQPALPLEVESIDIFRPQGLIQHCWSPMGAGYANSGLADHLQSHIDGKRAKYQKYMTRCDTCWLVIYSSGLPGVSCFSSPGQLESTVFNSPFERTFYLEGFSQRPMELRTTN